jgi:putative endonuclease
VSGARRRFGVAGEDAAAAWYLAAGYQVLDRNWRCDEGEIDLVCRRGGAVVVCEVKARASTAFGTPFEAVTASKRRRLRGLGARWLREHAVSCDCVRFDVVGVACGRVEVVEGAF